LYTIPKHGNPFWSNECFYILTGEDDKEVFKYKGAIHPRQRGFPPH